MQNTFAEETIHDFVQTMMRDPRHCSVIKKIFKRHAGDIHS